MMLTSLRGHLGGMIKRNWKPLDFGQLKINNEVAVVGDNFFLAAICRDTEGHILKATSSKLTGRNPIEGEARAARLACHLAAEFVDQVIVIEGDCLNLVNQVEELNSEPDWDIVGEVCTIRRLLMDHMQWSFRWIPREANCAAHNLAKWCSMNDVLRDLSLTDLLSDVVHCDHAAHMRLPP